MIDLQVIHDKKYDLACVDPVYGIDGNSHRRNKGRGKLTKGKEYHNALWFQEQTNCDYFKHLFRVSKNQIVFGGNYFKYISGNTIKTPRRHEYADFIQKNPTNWIIWDKVNHTTSFNDCELIWTSYPIETEVFYFMWSGMMQGRSFMNGKEMNPYKHLNQKRIHPTEKPYEVYKFLINRFYVTTNTTVLDTHVGSGSLRIVCFDNGIPFEGYEIDQTYFKMQEDRFIKYKSQLKLI